MMEVLPDQQGEPPRIGIKELLDWIVETIDEKPDHVNIAALKYGVIIIKLLDIIWPAATDRSRYLKVHYDPQAKQEIDENWFFIEQVLVDVQIPFDFINQDLIRRDMFSGCYQALVFLYFLFCLARDHECEFVLSHPVDSLLTEFMSSEAPLACLVAGGSVELPEHIKEKIVTPRCTSSRGETCRRTTGESGTYKSFHDEMQHIPSNQLNGNFETSRQKSITHSSLDDESVCTRSAAGNSPTFSAMGVNNSQDILESGVDNSRYSVRNGRVESSRCMRVIGGTFTSTGDFSCPNDRKGTRNGSTTLQRSNQNFQISSPVANENKSKQQVVTDQAEESKRHHLLHLVSPEKISALEWDCDDHKNRGEKVLTALAYQVECMKDQLKFSVEQNTAIKSQFVQEVHDVKEAAALEIQRIKEECSAHILKIKAKQLTELQSYIKNSDYRIGQLEDDLAVEIEMLDTNDGNVCSGSDTTNNLLENKMTKLKKLMADRKAIGDLGLSELSAKLDDVVSRCDQYSRESNRRWMDWRKGCDLRVVALGMIEGKDSLFLKEKNAIVDVGSFRDEALMSLSLVLKEPGADGQTCTLLEKKLLSCIVDILTAFKVEHAHLCSTKLELQCITKAIEDEKNEKHISNKSILLREIELKEKLDRAQAANNRLSRTCDFFRKKIDALAKWRQEDEAFGKEVQFFSEGDIGPTIRKEASSNEFEKDKDGLNCSYGANKETDGKDIWLPSLLIQDLDGISNRDARLFELITESNESRETFDNDNGANRMHLNDCIRKSKLAELFWLLQQDVYRYDNRLRESRRHIIRLYNKLTTTIKEKSDAEIAARKKLNENADDCERKLRTEHENLQRTLGKMNVELMASQQRVMALENERKAIHNEQAALLAVLHESEHKRFYNILDRLDAVDCNNRALIARERLWLRLSKALAAQLDKPDPGKTEVIRNIWLELIGSFEPADILVANQKEKKFTHVRSLNAGKNNKSKEGTPRQTNAMDLFKYPRKQVSSLVSQIKSKGSTTPVSTPRSTATEICTKSPYARCLEEIQSFSEERICEPTKRISNYLKSIDTSNSISNRTFVNSETLVSTLEAMKQEATAFCRKEAALHQQQIKHLEAEKTSLMDQCCKNAEDVSSMRLQLLTISGCKEHFEKSAVELERLLAEKTKQIMRLEAKISALETVQEKEKVELSLRCVDMEKILKTLGIPFLVPIQLHKDRNQKIAKDDQDSEHIIVGENGDDSSLTKSNVDGANVQYGVPGVSACKDKKNIPIIDVSQQNIYLTVNEKTSYVEFLGVQSNINPLGSEQEKEVLDDTMITTDELTNESHHNNEEAMAPEYCGSSDISKSKMQIFTNNLENSNETEHINPVPEAWDKSQACLSDEYYNTPRSEESTKFSNVRYTPIRESSGKTIRYLEDNSCTEINDNSVSRPSCEMHAEETSPYPPVDSCITHHIFKPEMSKCIGQIPSQDICNLKNPNSPNYFSLDVSEDLQKIEKSNVAYYDNGKDRVFFQDRSPETGCTFQPVLSNACATNCTPNLNVCTQYAFPKEHNTRTVSNVMQMKQQNHSSAQWATVRTVQEKNILPTYKKNTVAVDVGCDRNVWDVSPQSEVIVSGSSYFNNERHPARPNTPRHISSCGLHQKCINNASTNMANGKPIEVQIPHHLTRQLQSSTSNPVSTHQYIQTLAHYCGTDSGFVQQVKRFTGKRDMSEAKRAWEAFVDEYRDPFDNSTKHLHICGSRPETATQCVQSTDQDNFPILNSNKFGKSPSCGFGKTDEAVQSTTPESTDSAMQDVLDIENGFAEEGLARHPFGETDGRNKKGGLQHEEVFIADDINRLGLSATSFLRRLSTELEAKMHRTLITNRPSKIHN